MLPGVAVDLAAAAGGVAALLVPADDPDGPRSVVRFDPEDDGSLAVVADDLPPAVDAVGLLDLDGDGRPEVIVGEPGRLWAFDPGGDPAAGDPAAGGRRLLVETPGLDLGALRRRGLVGTDPAWIALPRLGRLELYRGAAMALEADFDLPVRAKRGRAALWLSTPQVRPAAGSASGASPVFAVGPEPHGSRRLLTTLVDPSADEPEARTAETWAQLPANERISQSWVLAVDGRPMLAVAALSADKLGIFEKKKLRVFPLLPDRTRAGSPASLEIDTATRNWYDLGLRVVDFDLDGRDDLAVIQPEGLGAGKLVVEVYRGQGNGGFFRTPRRSMLAAPGGGWAFGADATGDRVADLVTAGDRLEVFAGLLESRKKQVVEKKPRWSLEMPPADAERRIVVRVGDEGEEGDDSDDDSDSDGRPSTTLEVVDFGGDGRAEILLRSKRDGVTVLRVYALR